MDLAQIDEGFWRFYSCLLALTDATPLQEKFFKEWGSLSNKKRYTINESTQKYFSLSILVGLDWNIKEELRISGEWFRRDWVQ